LVGCVENTSDGLAGLHRMSTLLVASTGGHLKELHYLHRRLANVRGPFRWATFDTPQSRSLLDRETVDFVPFVDSRDLVNVMRNVSAARRILSDPEVDTVVSTGAAVALPFMALARAQQLFCHYIESSTRADGPSITGRLLSRVPGVHLYSQYPDWARDRWSYSGSVFDSFQPSAPARAPRERLGKVVVTVGTCHHDFSRLIRRLLGILPADAEVLWQTGNTDTSALGISAHYEIPERDLMQAMREADVVVSHAGAGTAIAALEVGKRPVIVPRRLAKGEQIDDHQTQIARELGDRGLSISVEADELSYDDLLVASGSGVTTLAHTPSFAIAGTRGRSGAARKSWAAKRA
jgi:UDP-N-acetylglucosamine--N-acetylmuramyl-(pentapeptide) pyrophosphoryl-undecaprenol N-acetylglucosamine transferase